MINIASTKNKSTLIAIYRSLRLSRPILNIVFIIVFILLLILSVSSYNQVKSLISANKWVEHTYQVIHKTESSLAKILEIESLKRAYLATNDAIYINDVNLINNNLKLNLDELLVLTKDNKDQSERVKQFAKLTTQRLDLLNELVNLKSKNELNNDKNIHLFDKGLNASNLVKNMGREIISVELVLLNERNSIALTRASKTNFVVICGNILSILSLIVGFIIINLELAARGQIESHYKNTQNRLRRIIEGTSDMIAAFDKQNHLIIFNQSYYHEFKKLFGKSIAKDMPLNEAFSDILESNKELRLAWERSLEGSDSIKKLEVEINGELNTYEITSSLIQDDKQEISGTVQIVRNITARIQEHTALQQSYEKLATGMTELQDKNNQIILLVEMSDIMLACNSQEELTQVMLKFAERLLPFASGYLYVMHPSKNYLEVTLSWGTPIAQDTIFTPEQCWAIKLGRRHKVGIQHNELLCQHIHLIEHQQLSHLCVPLMAQNDIYGLLYLEDGENLFDDNNVLLINAFSELAALALANVRLRENLRHQSIRDPLTGLYNRRYLEELLFKQLHQAERANLPLSILMLDMDHFKKINDTFGHDAGDAVLKELGKILLQDVRSGDIATRYGGEEFIVLMFNITLEATIERAENIRQAVSMLQIKYGAQDIGPVRISIGISTFPKDGKTPQELVEAADKALYYSKKSGRNKVIVYSEMGKEHLG